MLGSLRKNLGLCSLTPRIGVSMKLSFNSLKDFSGDQEKETLDVSEAPIKTCKAELAQRGFAYTSPGSVCRFTNDLYKYPI